MNFLWKYVGLILIVPLAACTAPPPIVSDIVKKGDEIDQHRVDDVSSVAEAAIVAYDDAMWQSIEAEHETELRKAARGERKTARDAARAKAKREPDTVVVAERVRAAIAALQGVELEKPPAPLAITVKRALELRTVYAGSHTDRENTAAAFRGQVAQAAGGGAEARAKLREAFAGIMQALGDRAAASDRALGVAVDVGGKVADTVAAARKARAEAEAAKKAEEAAKPAEEEE